MFLKKYSPMEMRCLNHIAAFAALLFFSIFVVHKVSEMSHAGGSWQSRAKGTLRSIGSSQLAFQGVYEDHRYGTFDELKEKLYIAEGYTLGNMIENYSITWEVYNLSTVTTEIHEFTVIAYPRDTRPGFLNTFAITEDQVVRVYNPRNRKNKNRVDSVKTWDPIM